MKEQLQQWLWDHAAAAFWYGYIVTLVSMAWYLMWMYVL
jgi:hypothetical protein